jgi:hypothetical protein
MATHNPLIMNEYSISSDCALIRDDANVQYSNSNKALQAELARIYSDFLREIDTEIKNRDVPLKMSEKQNLAMLFQLILDMHTAVWE